MSETVVIIDYGSGNLRSAAKAFARAAQNTGSEIVVTDDPEIVRGAHRIVLPGVGAFADCMNGLVSVPGLRDVLEERVRSVGVPFFGICVGMQLMASVGREKGEYRGLDWIPGAIEKIVPRDQDLKVPHMGWNTLQFGAPHTMFDGIPLGDAGWHAYFVHSYHFRAADPQTVLATAEYGEAITAAVGRDNMFGTQFHPEKSQKLGLALIENFLLWSP